MLKTGESGSNSKQSNIGLDITSKNKSKPKMLLPRNLRLVFGKLFKPKVIASNKMRAEASS